MSIDQSHGHGTEVEAASAAGLPERFENPGLEPHRHRMADIDPKAAKRAERQVAALFAMSTLGTLLLIVAYYAFPLEGSTWADLAARLRLSNTLLGVGLALATFGIGAGAVHWAKTLMPDEERIELRHPMRGTDEDRDAAVAILKEGAGEAGLGRRPLIRNSLLGALVPLTIGPPIVLLRDTGPLPGNDLSTTFWKSGMALVHDPITEEQGGGRKIKASDLAIGSVVHVLPEGINEAEHELDEIAKAAVLLMRLNPDDLDEASRPGSYQGIVAYSKICTHMGCPVALYEQQTHHLLCPCHQSTFDLKQNCKVIFGPAKRPLPQLAITVDDAGYLIAKSPFNEAVGPSFWERG